jgi:hypothetical protein
MKLQGKMQEVPGESDFSENPSGVENENLSP